MNVKEQKSPAESKFFQAVKEAKKGDAKSAINFLDQAIALDPEQGKFYLRKSKLMLELGNADGAISVLQTGVARNPADLALKSDLMSLLAKKRGKLPEAIAAGRAALALDPKNPKLMAELSGLYVKAKKLPLALDMLEQAIANAKGVAVYHLRKSRLLAKVGRRADAMAAAKMAQHLAPNDVKVITQVALLSEEAGDIAGALSLTDRVLQLAPADATVKAKKAALQASLDASRRPVELKPDRRPSSVNPFRLQEKKPGFFGSLWAWLAKLFR